MLDVKRKYRPSLDPISEIFEPDQLSILKPIIRDGAIKREVDFINTWKKRIYVFEYVPQESISCAVYIKFESEPEEIIDLSVARLSKKCT
jgi:hypothetical protein